MEDPPVLLSGRSVTRQGWLAIYVTLHAAGWLGEAASVGPAKFLAGAVRGVAGVVVLGLGVSVGGIGGV